jgi:uncharacterized protein (TIGR04222 family)
MTGYAAQATWGVPGPTFLIIYLLAAVALAVLATLHRRALFAGSATPRTGELAPQQAAYLNGGERLAIYTALGGLRAAGAIGTADDKTLVQMSAMPAGATPLDAAVYNAAGNRIAAAALPRDPWVAEALGRLRDGLEAAGLATTAAQRRTVRLWALAGMGLAAVGVLRLIAGVANDRPVEFLVLAISAVVILWAFLVTRVRQETRTGRAALEELRSRHAYLAPDSSPAYATYGASGAAMGVALYGTPTLFAMDPAFAAQAGIQREAAGSATSGGYSSGGGGSCGSGSSCGGGGSSCGGGGCGG